MRCPACYRGGSGVESTKNDAGASKTVRYCRCPHCKHRFKTIERPVSSHLQERLLEKVQQMGTLIEEWEV